ncbi:MAG: hypothetical protein JWQ58_2235 [Reyranella sp.]|nr:hypothetical protein [Reyranella sp.]
MAISANQSRLIWSPLVGWVLLTCATSVVQAQSETSSPAAQILIEQTPTIDIPDIPVSSTGTVNASGEVGIAVGAFTLYPSLEVQAGYDSNVYATSAPTVGSPYTLIRPVLELKSDWLNHSLRVMAGGGFGFYSNASTQNYWNGYVQADGRLDIREDFYATGMIGVRRQTEALGTPNAQVATSPTVVDSIPVEVGLYQRFNRFFYDFKASVTRYQYTDNSIISAGGLPAASRNRIEYDERVRLGYEILEGVDVWVTPGLNQRIYDQFVNAFGQQRDSNGWNVNLGATIKFTTKSSLEGFIGYTNQTYIADGTSTPAFTFGLAGSWNGYEPLTLRPAFIRTINESAYSNYTNYVSTTLGVDFSYDIHDAWQMVGGTGINMAEYTPAPGSGVGPRTDYYWRASLGLLYALRPQIQVGPLYEHTTGWSTDVASGGPSYNREVFSLRVVAKR